MHMPLFSLYNRSLEGVCGAAIVLRLIPVQSFNTRLPRVIYHQKAFETMDEMGPPKMHSFISRFHRRAIAFNYYEHDWVKSDEMKFSSPQC